MKAIVIGFFLGSSFTVLAQVRTYSYPRIDGNPHSIHSISAYISPKSSLDQVCQELSGGHEGTYAISRKTVRRDTGTSESPYYRNLVKITKTKNPNWNNHEWFLKQAGKERSEDKVISELTCMVYGLWTTEYIQDNSGKSTKPKEQNSGENTSDFFESSEVNSQTKENLNLSCDGQRAYTYGWGGQRYDSSNRSDCTEAKNEAIKNCLYAEGVHGASACQTNVSSCLTNLCSTSFLGRTYGWGGQNYESFKRTTCAQSKQEAINNCLSHEGSRGSAACQDNASCVELND